MNTSEQGQNPQYTPPPVVQQTVIVMGQNKKSVVAAFLLTFFFGPLGLLYASIPGGIIMFILDIPVAIFTLGFGLIFTNLICVAWALIAVNNHNKRLNMPQHFQQVHRPAPPPTASGGGGFSSFGTPPTPPSPPPAQPFIATPPPATYTAPPPTPEFHAFNAPAVQPPRTETPGRQPVNAFGDWMTQNMKGLLIAAGGILGIVLLVVAIRFLLSLDFSRDTQVDPAPEPKEPAVQNTAPAAATQPAATPYSPPANSPASDDDTEVEPTTGYGFVQTKLGSRLNLRELPSKEAKVIKSIPNASFVRILGYTKNLYEVDGESGRWCKISHVGTEGWAWEKFIVRSK